MNWFNNISISFSYHPLFFIAGIIILLAYSIFIYRTTLPPIGLISKTILIIIRSVALFLILFLIFDPLLKITSTNRVEPKTLVFIDNSKSIVQFTPSDDIGRINEIVSEISENLNEKAFIYSFSDKISEYDENNGTLTFDGSSTDFTPITSVIKSHSDVASAVIITDGLINEGENPKYDLGEMGIPVFTVGIGDTTKSIDLIVDQIRSNSTIYTDRETEIEVILKSNDPNLSSTEVQLFDDGSMIESKRIKLSDTGINRLKFIYSSEKVGLHKLTVKVSPLLNEENQVNNSKSVIINILESKKKIAIIAGSPSRDLSAIRQSLQKNEEFETDLIVEIGDGKYYKNINDINIVKKSDIIFLVGFPSKTSDPKFVEDVLSTIVESRKDVFIGFSSTLDPTQLDELKDRLPFKIGSSTFRYKESQVTPGNNFSGLLVDSDNILHEWQNLAPITLPINKITLLGNSEILLHEKNGKGKPGNPVLFSTTSGETKSIVLTAFNFWRWQLKAPNRDLKLFDNLLLNMVKWLALNNNDFFNVRLAKKNYQLGEKITFQANVYDETFEPLNNEEIEIRIFNNDFNQNYFFNSNKDGNYETKIKLSQPGVYNYSANLIKNRRSLGEVKGTFNVEAVEIEMVNKNLDINLLNEIASTSGGQYYSINQTKNLINKLNFNYQNKIYFNKTDKELRLSNFELILLIIVLLFSIEWIMRKILRMI